MNGGSAGRGRYISLGILIAGAILLAPRFASAATMFLSPATGQFGVGRLFAVTIRVNTQGVAVNASEGTLTFDPSVLQVVSVTTVGSIHNLNVQDPEWSNANGTVRWAGVILNPGFNGTSGNLLTVNFKGLAPTTTQVKFASGAVLANDGQGTNVLNGLSGGTYGIGAAVNSPTPTPQPTGQAPEVTSSTHPDSAVWYSNNDPIFNWELPGDVDGVSYLISASPNANPGNGSDGLVKTVQFTDVPDGASYFHIKFRRNGAWGPVTHFPFNTDIRPPEAFDLTRTDGDDTTNPRPQLTFEARDLTSGVAKYLMRIGEGDWFEVPESPADRPYALPLQAPGIYEVTVEALDRAGNGTRAVLSVTVASIPRPVIVQYPDQITTGTPFMVSGTGIPGTTIRVKAFRTSGPFGRVLFSDETAATVDTVVDPAGRWFAQIPALRGGIYRLEANSIDDRGAVSDTSNQVTVRVGYSFLWRAWDFLRSLFGSGFWRWLLLLLLLLLFGWLLWWLYWWLLLAWRRRRREEVLPVILDRDEQKVSDRLEHIALDMDEELALLSKIGKNRPLYPEEKYLRSKLVQYRKAIKFLLTDTHSRLAKKK